MNIFFIESPLQLLNALEAKYFYHLSKEDSILVVLNAGSQENLKQIQFLIDSDDWGMVQQFTYNIASVKNIFGRIKEITEVLKETGGVERVFIGEYKNQIMRHFANTYKKAEVILLDDGAAILNVYNRILKKERFDSRSIVKRLLKRYVLGIKYYNIKKLTFFTAYDLKETANLAVEKNEYACLKKRISSMEHNDAVYLLGQPMSEKNIMDEEAYLEYIRRLAEFFPDKNVIYIKHRSENDAKMKKIEELFGITVKRFNTCIEYELAYGEYLPFMVIGFYSSALINCSKIFKDYIKLKSFYFANKDIKNSHKKDVENIYNYFEKELEVVEI